MGVDRRQQEHADDVAHQPRLNAAADKRKHCRKAASNAPLPRPWSARGAGSTPLGLHPGSSAERRPATAAGASGCRPVWGASHPAPLWPAPLSAFAVASAATASSLSHRNKAEAGETPPRPPSAAAQHARLLKELQSLIERSHGSVDGDGVTISAPILAPSISSGAPVVLASLQLQQQLPDGAFGPADFSTPFLDASSSRRAAASSRAVSDLQFDEAQLPSEDQDSDVTLTYAEARARAARPTAAAAAEWGEPAAERLRGVSGVGCQQDGAFERVELPTDWLGSSSGTGAADASTENGGDAAAVSDGGAAAGGAQKKKEEEDDTHAAEWHRGACFEDILSREARLGAAASARVMALSEEVEAARCQRGLFESALSRLTTPSAAKASPTGLLSEEGQHHQQLDQGFDWREAEVLFPATAGGGWPVGTGAESSSSGGETSSSGSSTDTESNEERSVVAGSGGGYRSLGSSALASTPRSGDGRADATGRDLQQKRALPRLGTMGKALPASMGRRVSTGSGAAAVQLAHTGLRPHQIDRVAVLLESMRWATHVFLDGNLLTDASVVQLARALVASPAARTLRVLDLSANAALTWRCCQPLAALLGPLLPATAAVHNSAYGDGEEEQSTTTTSSSSTNSSGASSSAEGSSEAMGPEEPLLLPNPLKLRRLRLAGVRLGDKGASLLAAALEENSDLQVLELPRCSVRDAGCAAICRALGNGPGRPRGALRELDLSWNACGRATALALEAVFRGQSRLCGDNRLMGGSQQTVHKTRATQGDDDGALLSYRSSDGGRSEAEAHPLALRVLRLRNNGISDEDGAAILDALRARVAWRLVDLSENLLEGGAAVCACTVVAAMEAADRERCTENGYDDGSISSASSSSRGGECSSGDDSSNALDGEGDDGTLTDLGTHWRRHQAHPRRRLLLDGNPLGASGAQCVMRAMAVRPPIAHVMITSPVAPDDDESGWRQSGGMDCVSRRRSLDISIRGCSLVAGDRGFRLGMSDSSPTLCVAPQVPTLHDAVQMAAAGGAAGGSKATQAAASPPDRVVSGSLVVTERAAGLNLCSPAGRYRLSLSHPATEQILGQLLDLRARLVAFQQQEEAAAAVAAAADAARRSAVAMAMAAAAARAAADAAGAAVWPVPRRRSTVHDYLSAVVRRASRSDAPPLVPSTAAGQAVVGPQAAGASAVASRRASVVGAGSSAAGTRRQTQGELSASGAAAKARRTTANAPMPGLAARAHVQRFRAPPIDALALAEVQLDGGKPVKLDRLLQLQPWVAARLAARGQQPQPPLPSPPKQPAAAAVGGGVKKAPKRARVHQTLSFAVRIAALPSAEEPAPLPSGLLAWALAALRRPGTDDNWRLRLVELLLPDWLIAPPQAHALLDCFDRDMGQEQRSTAAQLVYMRLVQPLEFWPAVLPAVLKPAQQEEFRALAAPWLTAIDRSNLTGRYVLNLGRLLDRAAAQRLQLAALQEGAWRDNRYFVGWRNASLDGRPLQNEALLKLQSYAIPVRGTLRLDYVCYTTPAADEAPAPASELAVLLRELRTARNDYLREVLAVRAEYLPRGRTRRSDAADRAEESAKAARARHAAAAYLSPAPSSGFFMPGAGGVAGSGAKHGAAASNSAATAIVGWWWEPSGLDPSGLIQEIPDTSNPAAAAAAAAAARPGTSSGGVAAAGRGGGGTAGGSGSGAGGAAASGDGGRVRSAVGVPQQRRRTVSAGPAAASASAAGASTAGARDTAAAQLPADARSVLKTRAMLARLLRAPTPQRVAAEFASMGDTQGAAALTELARLQPGGLKATGLLLDCLSPVIAARLALESHHDPASSGLLSPELRAQLLPLLPARTLANMRAAAADVAAAASRRSATTLAALRTFGWGRHVSCAQLGAVLRVLGPSGLEDRVSAVVTLWSRVVDRGGLVEVFESLTSAEQLEVMRRLGFYLVWATLARPEGLHFRLDLRQQEQRDVAREVVKVAVRKSLAEKARSGQRVRQLLALTAEGKPVADPEDEKLWLSLESKHHLLEFDYARTWEQELHLVAAAVKRIQRAWRHGRHPAAADALLLGGGTAGGGGAALGLGGWPGSGGGRGEGGSGGGSSGAACSCCSCSCGECSDDGEDCGDWGGGDG